MGFTKGDRPFTKKPVITKYLHLAGNVAPLLLLYHAIHAQRGTIIPQKLPSSNHLLVISGVRRVI